MKYLQHIPGIMVKFSVNGWRNDALTAQYLHSIIGSFFFTKRLLIQYGMHTTAIPANQPVLKFLEWASTQQLPQEVAQNLFKLPM